MHVAQEQAEEHIGVMIAPFRTIRNIIFWRKHRKDGEAGNCTFLPIFGPTTAQFRQPIELCYIMSFSK
jgi:hypothetical protein